MNKKQQESVLMGALSGRTFTLRADALGDKVVEDSLRGLFPDGWLRVEDAELTSDDGAITVTGRASVFRVPTATLTVTFLLGDTPALVLSASSFPMTRTLAESFPDHAIHGEELGRSGPDDSEHVWIVDPLDGTTNFVHSHPMFTVFMGLMREGQPYLGVVHAPVLGETFTAVRGEGANLNGQPIRSHRRDAID